MLRNKSNFFLCERRNETNERNKKKWDIRFRRLGSPYVIACSPSSRLTGCNIMSLDLLLCSNNGLPLAEVQTKSTNLLARCCWSCISLLIRCLFHLHYTQRTCIIYCARICLYPDIRWRIATCNAGSRNTCFDVFLLLRFTFLRCMIPLQKEIAERENKGPLLFIVNKWIISLIRRLVVIGSTKPRPK